LHQGLQPLESEARQRLAVGEEIRGFMTLRVSASASSRPNSTVPLEAPLAYMEHATLREIDAMLLAGTGTQSLPLKGTLSASPVAIWLLNA
jgi:hypothetical protein